MKKKIISLGASNSTKSINRTLAHYASKELKNVDFELLDLNDYEMPIYSADREAESGIPELAHQFKALILEADGILISFAEHNGAYSAAYKNIYDWVSRIESDVWGNKPMLLMATSPGSYGGKSVLAMATARYERANKKPILNFSLPSFYENFSNEEGIKDSSLREEFYTELKRFQEVL
ncbi:NAD(P)H-dependent oxidoreductase [Ancylomarina euxinus]|uniref:NAD(P)H-dependent oxidoreductase n=1 Tax=Ancylomarina euxinus TaxID=2283627 RepID=A0A425XWM4_9BACT|nr:NADPH-dependent FMN reductase [Ancylomarina euxinus]MCZ4696383.1 NAD(P)H-dependent oxidoreductase [Ancylomarina euxinus]MUP16464.1 NADPH-dependent FMN reductase [Ancylomarina euxinus]RRG19034.1 NAD(P)H-dependent oxidoreductase [Ancylomarina euxinus]